MLNFKKEFQSNIYLDPFDEFKPKEAKVETRWDPLTGQTSRIIYTSKRKFEKIDISEIIKTSLLLPCPFCPENIDLMTCKFDEKKMGFERFKKDGITIIPNLLPFDRHCIVAIISNEHFLDIRDLAEGPYLFKGFKYLLEVLKIIKEIDKEVRYFSINCNYMPMSGGSLLHPHVQAIAGKFPTNYHLTLLQKSREFYEKHGRVFWELLLEEEKRLNERYIGEIGKSIWFVPFAPRATIDVRAVFKKSLIFEFEDEDIKEINEGLRRILLFFDINNIQSFNFSLLFGLEEKESFRAQLEIIARRFIPPINASDSNYFDKLHGEYISYMLPEEVASDLKTQWLKFC